jgi:hypothetical protein
MQSAAYITQIGMFFFLQEKIGRFFFVRKRLAGSKGVRQLPGNLLAENCSKKTF